MIGGSGERKTLRTVARHARGWNTEVDLETVKRKLDALDQHCAEAGRDIVEIEFTLSAPCILRDDPAEARRVHRDVMARQAGEYEGPPGLDLFGPEERIAELWGPFIELGFRHLIPGMPAPLDRETLERLPRLREIVAGASG
jgi:alkanesulfonate monooxygenase SsuD/methylene tetrahydromethanopterin reductase-like flavin-dependent oxidoreductase (luciferase family)